MRAHEIAGIHNGSAKEGAVIGVVGCEGNQRKGSSRLGQDVLVFFVDKRDDAAPEIETMGGQLGKGSERSVSGSMQLSSLNPLIWEFMVLYSCR
jgi:hypothetical protein